MMMKHQFDLISILKMKMISTIKSSLEEPRRISYVSHEHLEGKFIT